MRLRISPLIRWIVIYGVLVGMIGFVPVAGARAEDSCHDDVECSTQGEVTDCFFEDQDNAIIPVEVNGNITGYVKVIVSQSSSPNCTKNRGQAIYVSNEQGVVNWTLSVFLRPRLWRNNGDNKMIGSNSREHQGGGYFDLWSEAIEWGNYVACAELTLRNLSPPFSAPSLLFHVCTDEIQMTFVEVYRSGETNRQNVSHNCAAPTAGPEEGSEGWNIWHFRIVAMREHPNMDERVTSLTNNNGGFWDNPYNYPDSNGCSYDGRWPMLVYPIIFDTGYINIPTGVDIYVAAYQENTYNSLPAELTRFDMTITGGDIGTCWYYQRDIPDPVWPRC